MLLRSAFPKKRLRKLVAVEVEVEVKVQEDVQQQQQQQQVVAVVVVAVVVVVEALRLPRNLSPYSRTCKPYPQ